MNPTIRAYAKDDLSACRELWVELTARHREIYDDATIGGDDPGRYFDEHLAKVGPENLWVAELEGDILGLTGLITEEGEVEIEPVVVRHDARRRGIGRMLVEHVVGVARERGARHVSARPVARNENALRFFHRMGLDVLGRVEVFLDLTTAGERTWREGARLDRFRF